jgi:tetratricopeptide (TPR) repeat protein
MVVDQSEELAKGPAAPEAAQKLPLTLRTERWKIAALLVLALAALFPRFDSLRDAFVRAAINPPLLKAAMTASDSPAGAARPASVPNPSGLQARAMAVVAGAAGDPTTAEAWLMRGLADPSSAFLTQFELCRLYWNEGERERAEETCRGTKASALYWLNQGYLADERGEQTEALAYYRMAGAVDPDMIPAWHHLGRTSLALGRYDEAISAFERVILIAATPPIDAYDSLSAAYLKLGNPAMARDALNRGLTLYPNVRTYYIGMAEAYRVEGDWAAADSWYARLLQRWPYDAQAWAARGEVAMADGRTRDAVAYFQEAVNNQPQGVGYWINLASAATASGDSPLALRAYRQAITLQPDNLAILLPAGRFLVETQRPDEAKEVLERVLALQPDNSEASALLAGLESPPRQ